MHCDQPGPADSGAEEPQAEPMHRRRRRRHRQQQQQQQQQQPRAREAPARPGKKKQQQKEEEEEEAAAKKKKEEEATRAEASAPTAAAAAAAAPVPGTERLMEGEKEASAQPPQGMSTREGPLPLPPWEEGSGDENTLVIIHSQVEEEEEAAAFKCLLCGEGFSQPLGLLRHQKQHHAGERTFVCAECGKGFGLKHNLITHQRTHTGEKPFACGVCGKCFSLKQNLLTHQRAHGEARPFACSACGKSFREQRLLLAHQKGGCGTGAKEKRKGGSSQPQLQGRHPLGSARRERFTPPRSLSAKTREKLDPNGTCWEDEAHLSCKNGPASHPKSHPTERPRLSKEEGRRGLREKEGPQSPKPRLRSEDASSQCLTRGENFGQAGKLPSHWQSHRDPEMLS